MEQEEQQEADMSVWMFSKLNSFLPFLLLLASKFQTVKKLAYCRCDAKKEKKKTVFS